MNKQQLASKIWESANKMRSKIEANEYKDYILGFIFYKYLSDKELKFLRENDFSDADIKSLRSSDFTDDERSDLLKVGHTEKDIKRLEQDNRENRNYIQENLGYFIGYKDLFSTWLAKGREFDASDVRDALSAFNRMIFSTHKKVFENIFHTLETGLSKLGDSNQAQTKAISALLQLIKDIPMDGRQGYDVLGFIYEYLIGMFAANAGKKAGEFYTPHEVSVLMSEIVAHHLKEATEIKIYDPTSGSGSLLINIGQSVAKYLNSKDNIQYYAQELKENTYNLTRMNLIMRDINPSNISTRNADTLEDDWPYFDENDPVNTYSPLYVDAVVSNPPYSQAWDPSNKDEEPRYKNFGLAPKTKADYAFLLHDLYHLKPNGVMTIVLPHGVLFRGGDEGLIRSNLIEKNHIDAIIGLPANIFFGTGIPTIIMVLRQRRDTDKIFIIDASKGFVKVGKNNMLRASDIKKITDALSNREEIPQFSRNVSLSEIRDNGYNLNIPRYVDSSDKEEHWDMYASMFGGIPQNELDALQDFWKICPNLKKDLFTVNDTPYVEIAVENIRTFMQEHADTHAFTENFAKNFASFPAYLKAELLESTQRTQEIATSQEEKTICEDIFNRFKNISLIDKYHAYQVLDDAWQEIAVDLEIIQTEGFNATKQVNPHIVTKKDEEVQEGFEGHIVPFELVQTHFFSAEFAQLNAHEQELENMESELEDLVSTVPADEDSVLNNDNDAFVAKELKKKALEILSNVETDEILHIQEYLTIKKEKEKLAFIEKNSKLFPDTLEKNAKGAYTATTIKEYIISLQSKHVFPEDSFEANITRAYYLTEKIKEFKGSIKKEKDALHIKTKEFIESMSDTDALFLLEKKWIDPLVTQLHTLPNLCIKGVVGKIEHLQEKYATSLQNIEKDITTTQNELCTMLDELEGEDFDMQGLAEFKKLLGGM